MMTNKLYVVATPIGNLNEFTNRAIEVLNNVNLIVSEDTRSTLKLCSHFNIKCNCIALHKFNEIQQTPKVIDYILEGNDVALTSDAGYPGISDPGSHLINEAIKNNIKVEVISGPCALINALVGSGLDTTHFYYYGFLPIKEGEKINELKSLISLKSTLIFYEAPHRINDTLQTLYNVYGNRKCCIARELTKIHEEYIRGTLEELINESLRREIKGEIVIIVEGNNEKESVIITKQEIIDDVNALVNQGLSAKDAIKQVSIMLNLSKNEVYKIYHE